MGKGAHGHPLIKIDPPILGPPGEFSSHFGKMRLSNTITASRAAVPRAMASHFMAYRRALKRMANQKLQTGLQTGAENACYHYILAIPAGFEPATHGVEIRYLDRCRIPYRYLPAFKPFAKPQSTALRLSPLAPSSSVREALKITIALQRADIPALST
jgi:hypothetical protein